MRLTDQKRKLLEDAVENDGVLEMRNAFRIYSGKESAKNAVKTLEAYDYVEYIEPGYFKVKKLPEDLEHLEKELVDENDFVKKIIGKVFKKFNRKKERPVDPEKVKYATDSL